MFPKLSPSSPTEIIVSETYEQIIKEVHLNQPQKLIIGHLLYHDNCKWIVKVIQNRGKSLSTMGYSTGNFHYLLLEEALYLMESGVMQISSEEIPITIEQMYNIISSTLTNGLDRYLVYKSIFSSGFIVRLHSCSKLREITRDYKIPSPISYLIDCADIPKYSSNSTTEMNGQHLSRLHIFNNPPAKHTPTPTCQILYDVYSDAKTFSKSKDICPDYFLIHLPQCQTILDRSVQCNEFIRLLVAVVDEGDVSFLQVSQESIANIKLIR